MSEQEFLYLLHAYKQHQLDEADRQRFMQLVRDGRYNQHLQDDLLHTLQNSQGKASGWGQHEQQAVMDRLLQRVRQDNATPVKPRYILWKYAAAAVVTGLLLTAGITWFVTSPDKTSRLADNQTTAHAALPAEAPTLTLSDGSVVTLDSSAHIHLGQQGGSSIQNRNGELFYEQQQPASATAMNILTVPKGRHYQLTLADGTRVWLNAGSSLEFPASFQGNSRQVMLTGEAYFEAAANPHQPFRVKAGNMTVDVLGTRFNIMAYKDEEIIRTTLLDGAVRVGHQQQSFVLKPGEQAVMNQDNRLSVNAVNAEEEIAWKDGIFLFSDEDITAVMRQLARWYNIEISYEGAVDKKFSGKLYRSYTLEQTLSVMNATGLQCKVKGNIVTVSN
ncbi:FecR family protein [Chitinophaga solisilvae]|uniref:FecR family protein n=1 Tax=Chitinophaga solisilvae TaxID=1233460 RepID=UPI00137165F2|nr:FecR family protein [Chitinophaga solisilvae]